MRIEAEMAAAMAHIVLINPRFETSFWGLEHALPFMGKRANMPVAALPLLAALTPAEHRVTIVDENVEPIDFARCAQADIVGVTGMVVQRRRMREILSELRRRGAFTVVGGPWITIKEDYLDGLADVIFIGEAEETWPQFLADWGRGCPQARYEQAEKTDLTRVPPPRLDLLKTRRYAFGNIQFSRGCPFLCEFCDIIVIFGRKPRLKSPAQVIAELENLRAHQLSTVFIVDDNLIGNKKAIKELLRYVIAWQTANGFPLSFVTEASLDLAEDDELMRLMVEAGIEAVFVGIESPDAESLREARKLQNVRGNDSLVDKVRRIQNAGMEVWAGMILGFDNDSEASFDSHRRFLGEARISTAMVGMLSALPKTPLYARLSAAGRLDSADEPAQGTNVIPLKMTRDELSGGYVRLMSTLYDWPAYFERLDDLYIGGGLEFDRAWRHYAKAHPWLRRRRNLRFVAEAVGILFRLTMRVPDRALRAVYRRQFWRALKARRNPAVLRVYMIKCAIHFHMHRFIGRLMRENGPLINSY
ncbi:MAG TPA: B12-binding domain-containing radical SAM protein [Pseudolabrys sp.]|nr:B12-binding domain-containing radical SAM protein [Pseudolabrys sp.]